MSASKHADSRPSWASASFRFTAVIALADNNAAGGHGDVFFTPGNGFGPRCTACETIFT